MKLYWKKHEKIKVRAMHASVCGLNNVRNCRDVQIDGAFGIDVNEFVELGEVPLLLLLLLLLLPVSYTHLTLPTKRIV